MGLHRISWRATASAVSNQDVVGQALAFLVGSEEWVSCERSASYYGPDLYLFEAHSASKKESLASFARLGREALNQIRETIESRLDEEHVLHIRLELDALVNGQIRLCENSGTAQVKGRAKIEVYPGQNPREQTQLTIESALELIEQ